MGTPQSEQLPDDTQQIEIRDKKQGINVAGDTVTQATADLPDAQRAIVRRVYHLAKVQGWSWSELEEHTKIDTSTWSRVWSGRYPAKLDNLCDRMVRFLDLWDARAPETKFPFIETTVWKRVSKVAQEALEMQTIAFIYGEPQVGKTACLVEYARRHNHGQVTYVLTPASAGVQSMMKAIAQACHISVDTCFEHLRDRVRNYFDDSRLLIMDEVHEVFVSYQKSSMVKCLDVLRQLQEQSGCGLVLCGTNVFRSQLEHGEFAQAMKQLRRRGIWELQIESVPRQEDVWLFSDYYKLPHPTGEAAELVKWIAHNMGLGKYTKFLHRAAMLASRREQRLTWDHFVRVVSVADALSKVSEPKWN